MKKVLLILSATALMVTVNAQITYYDYAPDEEIHATYAGESINIDFDNDQNPELTLYGTKHDTVIAGVLSTTITGFAITTFGNTEILGRTTTLQSETILEADTLLVGFTIDGTSAYVNSSTPSVFPGVGLTAIEQISSTTAGQYAGAGDKYIGVKFEISGATHYGWIKVNVSATHDTCVIDSYAYETTAATGIDAGDMGGGTASIDDIAYAADVTVVNNHLRVKGLAGGNMTVYNLLGKIEFSSRISSDMTFIPANELTSGVYLVSCKKDSQIKTYKVYKP